MQWYCVINGTQYGPVDEATLAVWVREGRVRQGDLVWTQAQGDQWIPAGRALPALFGQAASAQAVAPSQPDMTAAYVSRTHNRDLMAQARVALQGHWWLAAGISFVFAAITTAVASVPCLGQVVNLLIAGPLALGYAIFALAVIRRRPLSMGQLFEGFEAFGTALVAYILMAIFVLLWMLLLIIPGIIAALAYSMTYFILKDHPQLSALEAIRLSRQMMRGNKWKYFCLQWRFFGWMLLCLLTCGIGVFWLMPYMMASQVCFYEDLKEEQSLHPKDADPRTAHS